MAVYSAASIKGMVVEGILARWEGRTGTLEDFERELHQQMCDIEATAVGAFLERYDEDAPEVEVGGRAFRFKQRSHKTYYGLGGPIDVERSIYVPKSGQGRAICPMELRAGIIEGTWTPRAACVMAKSVALMPPKEAHDLFEELGGLVPSTSSLDRLPKALSERWELKRIEFEEELRQTEELPELATTVAVSLDGVQAPMKDTGRMEKRSQVDKLPKGPAGFREVGCGAVTLYDPFGERLETKKFARMPEQGKATLKSQLKAELSAVLQTEPSMDVVFLSDGARDHWMFAEEVARDLDIKDAYFALDMFHVLDRLHGALVAFHGEGSAKAKGTFEEWRELLRTDSTAISTIVRGLRYRRDRSSGNTRKVINQTLKYMIKYRAYMDYPTLIEKNLPVGSGVVEATCKTLVTERMKRSGMSWRSRGGQAVLTMRSLIQSQRWDRGWQLFAQEYLVPVQARKAG